jgi:hypothetical protein
MSTNRFKKLKLRFGPALLFGNDNIDNNTQTAEEQEYASQRKRILEILRTGKGITAHEASRLRDAVGNSDGIDRLSARIYDLREQGYMIRDEWEKSGRKRWVRYFLVEEEIAKKQGELK